MSFDKNDKYNFMVYLNNELSIPIIYRLDIDPKLKIFHGQYFVYFLYKDCDVIYVGRSNNIYQRLYKHKQFKDFDYVKLISCGSKKESEEIEKMWIERLEPELNYLCYN